jgi:hypothetical protein
MSRILDTTEQQYSARMYAARNFRAVALYGGVDPLR